MIKRKLVVIILFLVVTQAACLVEPPPEGMVLVPAGRFTMGTDQVDTDNKALALGLRKPWYADEAPAHQVYLKDFFIDKYEVTNKQYYIFCQATGHKPPRLWGGPKYPEGTGNHPVTHINFYDAAAYAEWAGKRLPTEAEWEKAARGLDNYVYPWGNEFDPALANVSRSPRKSRKQGLRPVGSYPQGVSYYGVHDMIGNAWEWIWDYYRPYPNSQYHTEAYEKNFLVVRGLSYEGVGHFPEGEYKNVVALKARAGYREKLNPFARKRDVGFRCAKDRLTFYEKHFKPPSPEKKEESKADGKEGE